VSYLDDINQAVLKSQKVKDAAITSELRKYRTEYKRSIAKIQNLIATHDATGPGNLGTLFKQIEKEMTALNNRLTRSAKTMIGKGTRQAVIDTKASLAMFRGKLKGGAKVGMKAEVFNKVWKRAMAKINKGYRGISLSENIWDLHRTTYKDIRRVITTGYADQKYVHEIMNEIRGFLYLSEADMRTTYWKEFYKRNPPGRGRYKSAYKNMDRLIRTEVTRGYREATAEYAKQKKWAKGVKWHRTSGTEECGECDEYESSDLYGLGDGVYPPDALPVSHPQCMCYLTVEPNEEYLAA